ncbi:MAG: hypothetical protein B7X76_09605, partial [Azorhizobium sp. 39-67-5]
RRALAHFPADQLLFLRSQDLARDPETTLARIASFLGLNSFPPVAAKRAFERPRRIWPCHPSQADNALISSLLAKEMAAFADLTGLDVSDWPVMTLDAFREHAAGAHVAPGPWRSQASGTQ